MTECREPDIFWASMLQLPVGSLVVFDCGFTCHDWGQELVDKGILFVTRLEESDLVEFFRKRPGRKAKGVVLDQEIKLQGINTHLRLVQFIAEDGNKYRFVTIALHLVTT